ncbi:MlaD family protein [Sulfurimonas sp.]|uniref:MlaD family protein n=1 Tax=Sulfurimonas sp. TaxID=2022749 RepID=UPI0035660D18
MNNKVNYTLIGILVVIGLAMIVVFSYWLLQPSQERAMKNYYVYFDESVLGLNIEAPVKFRGIDVGKVSKININPKNTEQVQVTVSILKTTPIKTTTRAKLTSQGITGLSYINLTMGENGTELLEKSDGERYPVIKSTPSFFEKFELSFGDVSKNLSKTLDGTQALLNEENQKQVTIILNRSAKFMDKLDRMFNEKTIKHFQNSIENIELTSAKLNIMMPKIENFIENSVEWENKLAANFQTIMKSYMGIKGSMDVFKASVARGDFNIKGITSELVPNINNTLLEMQQLIIRMDSLAEQYEKSPGDILYKTQEINKGPGE